MSHKGQQAFTVASSKYNFDYIWHLLMETRGDHWWQKKMNIIRVNRCKSYDEKMAQSLMAASLARKLATSLAGSLLFKAAIKGLIDRQLPKCSANLNS